MSRFVRYQASERNRFHTYTGIFALANGLARTGQLSEPDRCWWRTNNDWYDAAYPNPADRDPSLFDKAIHPQASCWFKTGATDLIARVDGYLHLLDRYGVGWVRLESDDPGRVLYEDDYQVVVEPY